MPIFRPRGTIWLEPPRVATSPPSPPADPSILPPPSQMFGPASPLQYGLGLGGFIVRPSIEIPPRATRPRFYLTLQEDPRQLGLGLGSFQIGHSPPIVTTALADSLI